MMIVSVVWRLMGGARGLLSVGAGGLLGAGLVWGWMSLVAIPSAERTAQREGFEQCRAEVEEAHQAELARQREANREALEAARARERDLAEQADILNEQLLDLADAITADDGSARLCLGAERVRDLNRIR